MSTLEGLHADFQKHLLIKVIVFHRILVLVSGLGAGFSATINMYRATKDMYILTRIGIGELYFLIALALISIYFPSAAVMMFVLGITASEKFNLGLGYVKKPIKSTVINSITGPFYFKHCRRIIKTMLRQCTINLNKSNNNTCMGRWISGL